MNCPNGGQFIRSEQSRSLRLELSFSYRIAIAMPRKLLDVKCVQ